MGVFRTDLAATNSPYKTQTISLAKCWIFGKCLRCIVGLKMEHRVVLKKFKKTDYFQSFEIQSRLI